MDLVLRAVPSEADSDDVRLYDPTKVPVADVPPGTPTAFWDPNAASGYLDNAGDIETLYDLSGNGIHLTQATAGLRPVPVTDGGVTVAQFTYANGEYLIKTGLTPPPLSTSAHTIGRAHV